MHVNAQLPGRILVIEDEKSARLLLDRVLTRAGHQVVLAETGQEGLERLSLERFDLLISDKNLPDLSGLEVLRRARLKHPELRAVVITGFPTDETRSQARELGIASYVTKPFSIFDIVAACDEALRASRA